MNEVPLAHILSALIGKSMSQLSAKTMILVNILFKSREAREASDILESDCGTESLDCDGWSPVEMERIRFAVLKLSLESEADLGVAIKLANTDWRDLLMAAGFSEDLNAHDKWYASIANSQEH